VSRQPTLMPRDFVVALKFAMNPNRRFTFAALAEDLALAASEVHTSVKRSTLAGLLLMDSSLGTMAIKPAIREFALYGVRYAFPAIHGPMTRGMVTGAAGPVLRGVLQQTNDESVVWPYAKGTARGPSLLPLYPRLPLAAERDLGLYEALTLIDSIRIGGARERQLAAEAVLKRLS
jgi:hypothetical protein